MANAKDNGANRAIPSAGPDFEHLLAQEVVIEAGDAAPTGAQRVAPLSLAFAIAASVMRPACRSTTP